MEAAEAAHKNANPDTELPVGSMETIVEEYASKYSSVSVAQGATYSVQMAEAYAVAPTVQQPGQQDFMLQESALGDQSAGMLMMVSHKPKPQLRRATVA